jgi:hypothetical protein
VVKIDTRCVFPLSPFFVASEYAQNHWGFVSDRLTGSTKTMFQSAPAGNEFILPGSV